MGEALDNATHLKVEAGVRYWEDATVNDMTDFDGILIPLRIGDAWCPLLNLAEGRIENWPEGMTADIHYKVCDEGRYWLLDADGNALARYRSDYVPDDFLCHGDNGYGDYIIMRVGPDGLIADYQCPNIESDPELWIPLPLVDGGARG